MRSRVLTADLSNWVDPAAVFAELMATQDVGAPGSSTQGAVWLDSGILAATGRSYLAVSSRAVLSTQSDEPVFEWMRREFVPADVDFSDAPSGFRLGWVGWLGYELRGESMDVPIRANAETADAAWLWVDRVIVCDHTTQTLSVMALGEQWSGELQHWREQMEALISRAARRDSRSIMSVQPTAPVATWRDTDEEYLAMIARCQDAIVDGDAYQLCLTTNVRIEPAADPVQTYLALRAANPSHHGGFVHVGGTALLSSSPEQFLSIDPSGAIETKPIKGTRRRDIDQREDDRLKAELLASDKERAENLMIVDLMRNDLGRVCEVGSVVVSKLFDVETYATVHQLVSTVSGQLRADVSGVDAIAASFPAGSMTGAPKHSATLILDSLESSPRGIYSGVFGYVGIDGAVDLAMVIRSIVMDDRGSTIGAGGGITALSVPAEELAEVKLKAAALLAVLGVPGG